MIQSSSFNNSTHVGRTQRDRGICILCNQALKGWKKTLVYPWMSFRHHWGHRRRNGSMSCPGSPPRADFTDLKWFSSINVHRSEQTRARCGFQISQTEPVTWCITPRGALWQLKGSNLTLSTKYWSLAKRGTERKTAIIIRNETREGEASGRGKPVWLLSSSYAGKTLHTLGQAMTAWNHEPESWSKMHRFDQLWYSTKSTLSMNVVKGNQWTLKWVVTSRR